MDTSLSWIKAYVPDLDVTAQEYTDAMTLTGTKVEGFEELDAEVPQENAASLAEHTAEQTKPEALAEADDTMEAGTSAEDVEAAILAETARQMAKESVEKEE